MVRLLLIRHAATAWTAQGRFQGQTDIPLSPHGRRQATALAQRLMAETLHMLYASDLQRAWETAQAIAAPHALHVHAEPRLREIAFGRWEGLTYAEMQQQDAQSLAAWERDQLHSAPPGGETLLHDPARQGSLCEYTASWSGQDSRACGSWWPPTAPPLPRSWSAAPGLLAVCRVSCLPVGAVRLREGGYTDLSQRYAPPVHALTG